MERFICIEMPLLDSPSLHWLDLSFAVAAQLHHAYWLRPSYYSKTSSVDLIGWFRTRLVRLFVEFINQGPLIVESSSYSFIACCSLHCESFSLSPLGR